MSKSTLQPVDPNATVQGNASPDPFDIATLRLDPSKMETTGVKKLRTSVPVRKPNPQDFFRVHPRPEYRLNVALIDLKEERESYLVRPEVYPDLQTEVVHATLFPAVNRQSVVFLWPLKFPQPDGRRNEWITTQREAAELAMQKWVRMKSNMDLGAYEFFLAKSVIRCGLKNRSRSWFASPTVTA